ncbi:hypothetical protein MSj_00029 [Microcystis aeruginosa Sj]|uniref:Uncharacterized protein n=1 Tax=Microcystis aeruginosa Sj TaxID=1979544 RepID=A0A2Z6UIR5_MICAE|nr:hypothetical protein [Microcystis aeruginosa]GBL08556.1 hypothetical protein MSj_00029 [Microcystis aeruginosa Sj]
MAAHSFWRSLKIPILKTTNHHLRSGLFKPTFLIAIQLKIID